MYTLTRKLSVVCLTVVLSFLVYGCGGSSKQALITDVSTDMVTAGLTPDAGTYNIQPGGTANAGDVTFACPDEGSSCEVTVADDGTVTSAGGMATAMTSASAIARLAAVEAARLAGIAQEAAEGERDAAQEAARLAGIAQEAAEETARLAGIAQEAAEGERDAAQEAARLAGIAQEGAEEAARLAGIAQEAAEGERDAAQETARLAGIAQEAAEETARLAGIAQEAAEGERDAAQEAARLAGIAQEAAEGERDAAQEAARLAGIAQEAAEGERDAAQEAARLAGIAQEAAEETARLAGIAQEAAEGERDAAQEAARLAGIAQEGAEEAARLAGIAQETAEGERDTAQEVARLAGIAQEAAEETARLAGIAQETAEGERDTAQETARLAGIAQETAEGERDTAQEAARLAGIAQETAEGERDTAIEERDAAVARAALLETINPFSVELAMGYGRVTPNTDEPYEINPGDTYTHPGDDVTFTCPDEGPLCVVIVSVNEDGVASFTSLGGAATGANSMSVMNTRMAAALHSPDNTGLSTGTAPAVTVTRGTAVSGGETEITLVPDEETSAEAEVEYTSGAVDTGHEIDGWSGQTMSRSEEGVLDTPQQATVYTNIDPATEQKLTLGDADEAAPPPDASNLYVLDPGEDVADINMDVMEMDTFRGTYNGIPGTFTCGAGTCETIEVTPVTGGQMNITNNFNADGWTFESDDFVESEATQDADYMYFGYWLQSPEDPGVENPEYMFAAFSGGADADGFALTTGLLGAQDEALTATYEGGAAGRYVTRKLRIDAEGVDPQSPGYHGRFTATATLTANFGTHEDTEADVTDPDSVATHNTIGGTITDFMDGATNLGFEVTLGRTEITTGGITDGTTTAKFSETATSTTANGAGVWSGQFFGPSADTSEEVMEDPDTHLPSGVAGQFNANSIYTNVVGAFAAE